MAVYHLSDKKSKKRNGWRITVTDRHYDRSYNCLITNSPTFCNTFFDIDEVIKVISRCKKIQSHKLDRPIFTEETIDGLIEDVKLGIKSFMYIVGLHDFTLRVERGCFKNTWHYWSSWKE